MLHTESELAIAVPAVDILLDYFGLHRWPSHCRVRLFRPPSGPVLIATELADNLGTSITNAIETVIATACRKLKLDPMALTVVEHYGAESWPRWPVWTSALGSQADARDDEFSRVDFHVVDYVQTPRKFQIDSPRWSHLPKPALESLLGGRLA